MRSIAHRKVDVCILQRDLVAPVAVDPAYDFQGCDHYLSRLEITSVLYRDPCTVTTINLLERRGDLQVFEAACLFEDEASGGLSF